MEPAARVLFVCLGNICRSPMAEAVFRHAVNEAGLAEQIEIDSAGTGDWHIGSEPHPGTQQELARNGVAVGEMRARKVRAEDLAEFDYVVAMDSSNLANLRRLEAQVGGDAEISLLLDDHPDGGDVPDPYLVGGYDRVYALVEPACRALLARIRADRGI